MLAHLLDIDWPFLVVAVLYHADRVLRVVPAGDPRGPCICESRAQRVNFSVLEGLALAAALAAERTAQSVGSSRPMAKVHQSER